MLLVIGVALILGTFAWILPRPTSLGQPATFQLVLFSPNIVYVAIYHQPDTSDQVILVGGPSQSTIDGLLSVPPGTRVLSCGHPSKCTGGSSQPIGTEISFDKAGGSVSVVVSGRTVGYDGNATTAYAQLPLVQWQEQGTSATPPTIGFNYSLPNASSYDWNTGPQPLTVGKRSVTWSPSVAPVSGELTDFQSDAVAVGGVDDAAQQRQTLMTFVAGALLGVGGGALIGALQEAVHVRRRDEELEGNRAEATGSVEAT
jgi:hypothetical protein